MRIRVGPYRVLYSVSGKKLVIIILKIGPPERRLLG
ncbi:MAG: hypothetical protein IID06_09140 [Gemmatimonadetes bacterium]|nr:hypothetical protein [Gemmatimonadota bacterium]